MDPVNAYSPLLSVYFLVKEKRDRERQEANPGPAAMPQEPDEKPLKMPDLPPPPAAYTNSAAYEMAGEKPTGGRSRPRARTHGEDDLTEGLKRVDLNNPPPVLPPHVQAEQPKKEGAAVGLLRRFSTEVMTKTGPLSLCLHPLRPLQFPVPPSLPRRQLPYREKASAFEGRVAVTKALYRIFQRAQTVQITNLNCSPLLAAATAPLGS
jgi:hypothetical protein